MSRRLWIILLFLLPVLNINAQVPFICDGRFYMTQVIDNYTQLVQVDIDPATQQVVFNVIRSNIPTIINGIGYRAEENLVYGVHPVEHWLYRIDALGNIETLAKLQLTPNYYYLGADITPDGKFLVLVGSTDVQGLPVDDEFSYVDLEDPGYAVTRLKLQGPFVNMLDVAFDPTNDRLYGFDSGGNRLVTIDPDGTVRADFPPSDKLENAGSVFFDIFGDLYAYGSPEGGLQNTLYAVDKNTGEFTVLTIGQLARATDACSCPFSVEVRKISYPEVTLPCTRVKYMFAIANQSTRDQEGILFQDLLPEGFTIVSILKNPFGGNIVSGPGGDVLEITDMIIPPEIDTLIIEVEVGDLPAGIYKNQAMLFGLPVGLGETRVSDDPRTLIKWDSTAIEIAPLTFDTMTIPIFICEGESLVLDASAYGTTFQWYDESNTTSPTLEIGGPGVYVVEAMTPCDTATIYYDVKPSTIDVSVSASATRILLGESIVLTSAVTSSDTNLIYRWEDPFNSSIACLNCPETNAIPFDNVTYVLAVENGNGCIAEDQVYIEVDFTRTFFAPNVFSPNGDGVNDVFYLQGFGLGQIEPFDIYNRWGGKVFSASNGLVNDRTLGWDGRVAGKYAEPAVYTWVAEISYIDGTRDVYAGDIALLR